MMKFVQLFCCLSLFLVPGTLWSESKTYADLGHVINDFQVGAAQSALGFYAGTFTLTNSKSFNGASCTPTQSFPATITVSGSASKPTAQLGNIPIAFVGKGKTRRKVLRGTYVDGTLSRNYVMKFGKLKSNSATVSFSELIKSGKTKACLFKHKGTFSRS